MYAESAKGVAHIDPGAIVDPGAQIGAGVEIGPFCRVGPDAVLEDNVRLISHVVIDGDTRIGAGTEVYPFTMLGGPPQHLQYRGEPTQLMIGRNCVIREHVTIHRGTAHGGGLTRIRDEVMLMTGSHVGHDCLVENHAIIVAQSTLGGHVTVGEHAIIGGCAGVHQFCRIGERAFVGGGAAVSMDVIPFGSVTGNHARLAGLNLVGLKRAGFPRTTIHALRAAYQDLFHGENLLFSERLEQIAQHYADIPEVMKIVDFIRADASRAILGAR